ncbi:pilus assembly PilX family protein [Pseudoxanthomonas wuyuanensis]
MRRHVPQPTLPPRANQRGAVLYIALVMLILLALIGIIGMQVSGLQEKMSANYRNTNLAFQNAEAQVRNAECFIESQINRTPVGTCTGTIVEKVCDTDFDATDWASERAMDDPIQDSLVIRAITKCVAGEPGLSMGTAPENEAANPIFQLSAYSTDYQVNPSADAAVDTIFRP